MSPVTHFLAGWAVGHAARLRPRDRAAVALAGIAPDIDGVGVVIDIATKRSDNPTELWAAWHHIVGHGITAALVVTAVCVAVAERRALTGALAFASFHLHVLCDVIGGQGPEGEHWPIEYLWPLSDAWQLQWSGQWALNAWPNFVITGALLAAAFYWAWSRGHSPLEIVSKRANDAFVATLRARFGQPASVESSSS
jgi:membrane-bound metal-dependent hydrolase YbcI (DUF457 family)